MSATDGIFTPDQDNDKTNVEPVHSYDAFHTRSVLSLPDKFSASRNHKLFIKACSAADLKKI